MRNLTKLAAVAATLAAMASSGANAVPIEWTTTSGGNGHFYDFVTTTTFLSWAGARAAASASSHNGQQGYLITLTSAAEQAFYIGQFGTVNGWIGGNDIDAEGVWVWADGPEAGVQFWSGGNAGSGGVVTPPFNYASWNGGEPNNVGNEDVAHFQGGNWNDLPDNNTLGAYLVEFNAAPIIEEPGDPNAVPEPMTLSLLGAGLVGIGLARRKRA